MAARRKKNSSQNRKQVFMKFGIISKVFKLHGAYLKNVPKTAKTFVVWNFMNSYSRFWELFFLRVLQGNEPFTINPITLCLPSGRSKPWNSQVPMMQKYSRKCTRWTWTNHMVWGFKVRCCISTSKIELFTLVFTIETTIVTSARNPKSRLVWSPNCSI